LQSLYGIDGELVVGKRGYAKRSIKYDAFGSKSGKTTIDYRECGANGAAMRVLPTVESYKDLNFLIPEINAEIPGGHI